MSPKKPLNSNEDVTINQAAHMCSTKLVYNIYKYFQSSSQDISVPSGPKSNILEISTLSERGGHL